MRYRQGVRAIGLVAVAGVLAATAVSAVSTAAVAAPAPPAARTSDPNMTVPDTTALTEGHKYRHGVVGTPDGARGRAGKSPAGTAAVTPDAIDFDRQATYYGGTGGVGVVTGQPKVYLVYWGSQWGTASTSAKGDTTFSGDHAGMAPVQQEFFKGLGSNHEAWSRAAAQYCQGVPNGPSYCPLSATHVAYPSGGVLAGVWYDNATALPASPDASQIEQESLAAAAHFGNTTAASNATAQYVIVSPTGITPDGWVPTATDTFCAWHDDTGDPALGGTVSSAYGNVAFTNMPYLPDAGANCGANFVNSGSAGLLDGVSLVGSEEYLDVLTDPFPAWASAEAITPRSGGWFMLLIDTGQDDFPVVGTVDTADVCAWLPPRANGDPTNLSLSTGSFPVTGIWSNDDARCEAARAIVDFNNDGITDVAGVDANNDLRLYSGLGNGSLNTGSGTAMWPTGGHWSGFKQVSAGDFNNDGHTDVIGVDVNNDLRLYKGKGDGTLDTGSGTLMWPAGGHWAGFKHIAAGEFSDDGQPDIVGVDANNDLRLYKGNGSAGMDTTSGAPMWPTGGHWANFKFLV